jgi:hypothetical protein
MKTIQILIAFCLLSEIVQSQTPTYRALFDNTKNETAGNADWIIDTDQPVPSPPQSGIISTTPENYWLGGISAWGVGLVKLGFTVHTLTKTYGITFGNSNNPYDLSNYNLFVVCEPQNPFTPSEKEAVKSFVRNGGGLFMIADHDVSDRDGDGWDSPKVWNAFGTDTLFGMHFQSSSESNNNISQKSSNVSILNDSIMVARTGTITKLSFYNGTTMRLFPHVNSTVIGHVWMNGAAQSTSQAMTATAQYGKGRVAAVGDSSPADDSTGQSGNKLYNGWGEAGVSNNILLLNISLWLAGGNSTTDVRGLNTTVRPDDFELIQNYPNPFNPSTTIPFTLSSPGHVRLLIFNTLGERVATLFDQHIEAGRYSVKWDAGKFASGAYYYRLQSGSTVKQRKLVLLR